MTQHVPFQVQLTLGQHRRLKALAEARGASMGSLIPSSRGEAGDAAADLREEGHDACRRAYERALRGRETIITTELVIAELHALAVRRYAPRP